VVSICSLGQEAKGLLSVHNLILGDDLEDYWMHPTLKLLGLALAQFSAGIAPLVLSLPIAVVMGK